MAPVLQLGEVSWSVACAAGCHMVLVIAVMHLCNIFNCLLLLCIFFFILNNNLVLINRRKGPRYQRVLASLTGAVPKGLIL